MFIFRRSVCLPGPLQHLNQRISSARWQHMAHSYLRTKALPLQNHFSKDDRLRFELASIICRLCLVGGAFVASSCRCSFIRSEKASSCLIDVLPLLCIQWTWTFVTKSTPYVMSHRETSSDMSRFRSISETVFLCCYFIPLYITIFSDSTSYVILFGFIEFFKTSLSARNCEPFIIRRF